MVVWSSQTRKRAAKSHKHRKYVKKQKQHLRKVKTESQLKEIRLSGKRKQPKQRKSRWAPKPNSRHSTAWTTGGSL